MKRFGMTGLCIVLFILFLIGGTVSAGIQGTKHDLSTSGSGNIRSAGASNTSGASQVCVFCHTPHRAAAVPGAPLWNKNLTSDPLYVVYTSDVLSIQGLNYPAAESPVMTGKSVHILKTRLCLSCHDGTIALGSLANVPYGFSGDMPMIGTSGGNMPTTAAGYIGINLRDDHPVAIPHKNGAPPGNDPELKASPFTNNKVKVFSDSVSGNNYVECTSCHAAHDNTNGNFLVEPNTNSTICTRCHDKAGFTNSIHNTSSQPYQPTDGIGGNLGTNVGGVKCMDCHFPHKAGVEDTAKTQPAPANGPYLLSFKEEQTCFNTNLDRWNTANSSTACHGTGGVVNVYDEVTKINAHKVTTYSGLHQATEAQSANWMTQWHVECQDCHNSHTAGKENHISKRGTVNGNTVAAPNSPLYGTGGVAISGASWPTWPPPSTGTYTPIQPAGLIYNTTTSVQYEYEICFKCHSDFAWNMAFPVGYTNQAMEFNPTNASFHPVAQGTGRNIGTLVGVWNANKGTQTMYCSDCHSKEGDVSPSGPHGSNNPHILVDTYDDTYSAVGTNQSINDLCFRCHSINVYMSGAVATPGTGFIEGGVNNLHILHKNDSLNAPPSTKGYRCVNCHAMIPHGYHPNKAMIVTNADGVYAPTYAPTGVPLINTIPTGLPTNGYKSGIANKNFDCTTVPGCH